MYEVYLLDEDFTIIHSSGAFGNKLTAMRLTNFINTIPTFRFSFLPDNPANSLLRLMVTRLRIVRTVDDEVIFEGRVVDYQGTIDSDNTHIKSYIAEDMRGVLNDSRPPSFSFKGTPGELIRKLFEHHNEQVEDWKQFALGDCELDSYIIYPDENTPINQPLSVGDKATISPNAKYIWNSDGARLNMSSLVKGVTHTIDTVGTTGVFADKYRLVHPNSAWGVSGWVQREDIMEARVFSETTTTTYTATTQPVSGILAPGTKVTIKESATVYYNDSYTSVTVPIASFIRQSTSLTVGSFNRDRYALYDSGEHVAWISKSDVISGTVHVTVDKPTKHPHIEQKRVIEVEINGGTTWENIMNHVIESVGGEIEREVVEGVNTLHIRNEIVRESETPIEFFLNMQDLQEAIDASDIVTKLRPIGRKAVIDSE